MGPKLVDYLLYEPEDTGILWIKFNRPERMNALIGLFASSSSPVWDGGSARVPT